MPTRELSLNELSRPIYSKKVLTRPVTQEQVVKAAKEIILAYRLNETAESATQRAKTLYETLLYKDVSEKEFELLKKEVLATCVYPPRPADFIAARRIFYDGVFVPTDADRHAGLLEPGYRFGREFLLPNEEMQEKIKEDFEQPQIEGRGFGGLLKSI